MPCVAQPLPPLRIGDTLSDSKNFPVALKGADAGIWVRYYSIPYAVKMTVGDGLHLAKICVSSRSWRIEGCCTSNKRKTLMMQGTFGVTAAAVRLF